MYRCEIMPISKKGRGIQMDYSDTYIVLYNSYVDVQNYKQVHPEGKKFYALVMHTTSIACSTTQESLRD